MIESIGIFGGFTILIASILIVREAIRYFKRKKEMEWILINDEKPICYEHGNWDGLKSDPVICQDKDGEYHVAICYEGILDGTRFFDWYDKNDFELKDIVKWIELD